MSSILDERLQHLARELPVAEYGELIDTLARVQGLPDLPRRVLTLRKVYGRSHAQIAERLGITEDQVRDALADAIRGLAR